MELDNRLFLVGVRVVLEYAQVEAVEESLKQTLLVRGVCLSSSYDGLTNSLEVAFAVLMFGPVCCFVLILLLDDDLDVILSVEGAQKFIEYLLISQLLPLLRLEARRVS